MVLQSEKQNPFPVPDASFKLTFQDCIGEDPVFMKRQGECDRGRTDTKNCARLFKVGPLKKLKRRSLPG